MSRASILTSVIKMISSDRAATHGDAHKQFATAQELKAVLRDGLIASGRTLSPTEQEALDLIATKLSRIVHGAAVVDHWADIAGYAAMAGEAVEIAAEPLVVTHSQINAYFNKGQKAKPKITRPPKRRKGHAHVPKGAR